ncbi:MAG: alpha/beta fold hydrolase [Thermoleophilia bacterium]|nr:alpha/beta fold hydrolase [Thermoleophilia bacterium]
MCLHGVGAHGLRYRRLADRLPGRRLVALDLRGHGRSGWQPPWDLDTHLADLLETVDALGLERPDWIGHSFGGRLVIELRRRSARLTPDELLEEELELHLVADEDGRLRYRYAPTPVVAANGELAKQPSLDGLAAVPTLVVRTPDGEVCPDGIVMWDALEETAAAVRGFLS